MLGIGSDVHYNRVKGYSLKYTIGYTANRRNTHRNIPCDYIKDIFIGALICYVFLGGSTSLRIPKFTLSHFVRYMRNPPLYPGPYNKGLLYLSFRILFHEWTVTLITSDKELALTFVPLVDLSIKSNLTRCEILAAVKIETKFLRLTAPCSLVCGYQHFGGNCYPVFGIEALQICSSEMQT